jgi:hypothetical protein
MADFERRLKANPVCQLVSAMSEELLSIKLKYHFEIVKFTLLE